MKNRKTPGQIAVIITLFIAVIILLSVVIINIGKVSDAKVNTSQISDRAALSLCSQLGTYVGLLNKKVDERANWILQVLHLSSNCAPNLGLILIAAAIVVGLVSGPAGWAALVMTGLVGGGLYMHLSETNSTQARAFSDGAYLMSSYTGFRESTIQSMLTSMNRDAQTVERHATKAYTLVDTSTNPETTYELGKDNPGWWAIDQELKKGKHAYRFNAWYWSRRWPHIAEAGILNEYINQFITMLTDNTKIDHWDPDKWQIDKLSLKTELCGNAITAQNADWIIDDNSIRVVGPVGLGDWLADYFSIDLFTAEGGFLITKFKTLTERILNDVCFDQTCESGNPVITYSKQVTGWTIPFLNWTVGATYNHEQIYQVNDDIRVFLTRAMETLNIPVSYRVNGVNNWLQVFYNNKSHGNVTDRTAASFPDDVYSRLMWDQETIQDWINQLTLVDHQITPIIAADNGSDCKDGAGDGVGHCPNSWCCNDTSCWCCSDTTCSWSGRFCTCPPSTSSQLCGEGDLYGGKPGECPHTNPDPGCTCGCSSEHGPTDQGIRACHFQGQMNWETPYGPTEVKQAVKVLEALKNTLKEITDTIEELAEKTKETLESNSDLKNEAVYGWEEKEHENYYIVRVKLADYPEYSSTSATKGFPYIKETTELFSFLKCWTVTGQTSGTIKTTVSSYTNDVPTGWWDLKVRRKTSGAEFPRNDLKAIIEEVHTNTVGGGAVTAHKGSLDTLINDYAISSATTGHYGATKEDIYIQKAAP